MIWLLSTQDVAVHELAPSAGAPTQVCTGIVEPALPQVVVCQLFMASPGMKAHVCTPVGPVVMGAGQPVLVQLLPPAAAVTVHDATKVGPVMIAAGQLVVVYRLPAFGPDAVHADTGTLKLLLVLQVISIQLFETSAVCGVQVATGTFGRLLVVQVMPFGMSGTHVPACLGTLVTMVAQSVRWYPLPAVAGSGVHEPTTVGPLKRISGGQVVVV